MHTERALLLMLMETSTSVPGMPGKRAVRVSSSTRMEMCFAVTGSTTKLTVKVFLNTPTEISIRACGRTINEEVCKETLHTNMYLISSCCYMIVFCRR